VATVLTGWDTDLTEDAVLVTSELVTNAIAHGNAPVTLTITVRTEPEPTVILDVADASPDLPVQDLPGEVGHFGLWIAAERARPSRHVAPRSTPPPHHPPHPDRQDRTRRIRPLRSTGHPVIRHAAGTAAARPII